MTNKNETQNLQKSHVSNNRRFWHCPLGSWQRYFFGKNPDFGFYGREFPELNLTGQRAFGGFAVGRNG